MFNKSKTQYKSKQVKFLGHIFNEKSLSPDPAGIEAVLKLEPPTNKEGLQRILGMVNYCCSFIPNLSALSANLRHLLRLGG